MTRYNKSLPIPNHQNIALAPRSTETARLSRKYAIALSSGSYLRRLLYPWRKSAAHYAAMKHQHRHQHRLAPIRSPQTQSESRAVSTICPGQVAVGVTAGQAV